MEIVIALTDKARNARIEGPTRKQAQRMAQRRRTLLDTAQAALKHDPADSTGRAFEADCEAFDIECDLRTYGYGNLVRS